MGKDAGFRRTEHLDESPAGRSLYPGRETFIERCRRTGNHGHSRQLDTGGDDGTQMRRRTDENAGLWHFCKSGRHFHRQQGPG